MGQGTDQPRATGEHTLRVRYAETDQMGVVYHANYLIYMEEGRTRLLGELGLPYDELERTGWILVVRRAALRYRAPARYGDEVRVHTQVDRVRGAAIEFSYRLERASDGECLATGTTELACLDVRGGGRRLAELPARVRDLLEPNQAPSGPSELSSNPSTSE